MLKKTSDNPTDYESDKPEKDFKHFGVTMKRILRPRRKHGHKKAGQDQGDTSSEQTD